MNFFKIFTNTTSQVVARGVSSGVGFLITILIARNFSLNGYSDLAKISSFVGLFYLVIDLGANAVYLQFEKDKQFKEFISFRVLLAFIVAAVVGIVMFLLPYNDVRNIGYSPVVKLGILLLSLSFFSRAIIYSTSAVFQEELRYNKAAVASIVGSIATVIVVGIFTYLHASLLWIVGAYVAGGFIEAGISLLFLRHNIFSFSFSATFFKKIFFTTLPFTILLFLNLFYFRIDMILLSFFKTSSAVGLYDFAYKFFDFLIALPLFLSNSLYPMLLEEEKYFRIQRKNIGLYTAGFFLLGLLLVPVVWIFSPLLIFVKHDFAPSIQILRILSLSLPIFFATNILQWIFITKKKQTLLVWVYGLSLILNVIFNMIFIPRFSYLAAAAITNISELLVLLAMIGAVALNIL